MKNVKRQYKDYLDSEEGAKKYNRFKDILYGREDSLIMKLFESIFPKLSGKNNLSILDIGGGDGRRLIHLIQLFREKGVVVTADLVEPSRAFTQNCRETVKVKKYPIRVTRSIFEKFDTKKKYDLILLIHSIYTFTNDAYLKKIQRLLKKDGLIVFVVNDEHSFLAGLKKITDAEYASSRNEIDALVKGLQGKSYSVQKFDTQFLGVLSKNGINGSGKLILEWIGMRHLVDMSADVKQKAYTYFAQKSVGGVIKEREVVIMMK